jgi:hypothetical protein
VAIGRVHRKSIGHVPFWPLSVVSLRRSDASGVGGEAECLGRSSIDAIDPSRLSTVLQCLK